MRWSLASVASAPEPLPAKDGHAQLPGFGRTLSFLERLQRPQYAQQAVFEPAEVAALIKYASEHGIDTDDHVLMRLFRALNEYNQDPNSELLVLIDGEQQSIPNAQLILREYSRLTKLTDGVNGRNLLHGRHLVRETQFFLLMTLTFFLVSIGTLAYGAWVADETPADDPWLPPGVAHTIQYFAPFAWGALGSCVYILKRISDEAAANRFDPDQFQGWQTRALLGAILGGTITYIVDPAAFGTATLSLTAIAFLAGLGTKVVYGGLERMITLLTEKLNLDAVAKTKPKANAIAEFLAKEISNTDPVEEPEKYKLLVQLLESRTHPN